MDYEEREFLRAYLEQLNNGFTEFKKDFRADLRDLKDGLKKEMDRQEAKTLKLEEDVKLIHQFKWRVVGISLGVVAAIEIISRSLTKIL